MTITVTDQQCKVSVTGHPVDRVLLGFDQPNRTNGWRRQNGSAIGFIIQRYIARNDWHIQCGDGCRNTFDRPDKLAHDLGLFRIAKIHIISGGQWFRPHGNQVAIGFCHRLFTSLEGVGLHITRRDITGESQ